jgi:hypothetical protein
MDITAGCSFKEMLFCRIWGFPHSLPEFTESLGRSTQTLPHSVDGLWMTMKPSMGKGLGRSTQTLTHSMDGSRRRCAQPTPRFGSIDPNPYPWTKWGLDDNAPIIPKSLGRSTQTPYSVDGLQITIIPSCQKVWVDRPKPLPIVWMALDVVRDAQRIPRFGSNDPNPYPWTGWALDVHAPTQYQGLGRSTQTLTRGMDGL